MGRFVRATDALMEYLSKVGAREVPAQIHCREETQKMPMAMMQIAPEQGAFMALLAKLTNARKYIEIGTFTGYSALSVALALPPDGRVVACDVNEEWTAMARKYWAKANVADRIELRLAPALRTLDGLIAAGEAGRYDFAFIDADKSNYPGYYERCLTLVRKGGLVAVDNTLWSGAVADPSKTDKDTVAIRAFNDAVHSDARVELSLLPIGDGLTLALKK